MVSVKVKIYDWARDRNDFFCIHEAIDFFTNIKAGSVTGTISALVADKKLTRTDSMQPCKMQSKLHSFYIYNKPRPEIPSIENLDNKVKNGKNRKKGERQAIILELAKSNGEICIHDVIKTLGINLQYAADNIRMLKNAGFLLEEEKKKECSAGKHFHRFYTLNNDAKDIPIATTEIARKPRKKHRMSKKHRKRIGKGMKESFRMKAQVLVFNPNDIRNGYCMIITAMNQEFAVCKEEGKIKIFPVEE
jgi:predicted transcriptional regulator